jgi:LmbE family N-acetylglucosaminyl deacetylase
MKTVCVVAPHPDDETLSCGGTLLRHRAEGDEVHWCIVTAVTTEEGFSQMELDRQESEISAVANHYDFSSVHKLGYPTTKLDTIPLGEIIRRISDIFQKIRPQLVYLPSFEDVHTDHRIVFDAVVSSSKWFRCDSIKRLLAYETLSETDFGMKPPKGYGPNVFIDIAAFLDRKISIMEIYAGQMGDFPFPRSAQAIRALAALRGAAAGCAAAEAFILLKEIL